MQISKHKRAVSACIYPTIWPPRLELFLLHCDLQLRASWSSSGPIHESQRSRKARVGPGVGVPAERGRCLPLNFCSNFVAEEDMSVCLSNSHHV